MATAIADAIWDTVGYWSPFARDTLGRQLVRAADSVAGNIAESYGRYHYAESVNLLYYARGSLYETKHWVARGRARNLIDGPTHNRLVEKLQILAPKLHAFIRSKKQQRQTAR
jgi:four helix bundle protein